MINQTEAGQLFQRDGSRRVWRMPLAVGRGSYAAGGPSRGVFGEEAGKLAPVGSSARLAQFDDEEIESVTGGADDVTESGLVVGARKIWMEERETARNLRRDRIPRVCRVPVFLRQDRTLLGASPVRSSSSGAAACAGCGWVWMASISLRRRCMAASVGTDEEALKGLFPSVII
jgi:hypothetical protein